MTPSHFQRPFTVSEMRLRKKVNVLYSIFENTLVKRTMRTSIGWVCGGVAVISQWCGSHSAVAAASTKAERLCRGWINPLSLRWWRWFGERLWAVWDGEWVWSGVVQGWEGEDLMSPSQSRPVPPGVSLDFCQQAQWWSIIFYMRFPPYSRPKESREQMTLGATWQSHSPGQLHTTPNSACPFWVLEEPATTVGFLFLHPFF